MKSYQKPLTSRALPRVFPRALVAALSAALLAFGLAGCSTPGPTHAYFAATAEDPISDHLNGSLDAEVQTRLVAVNELYGIAYDPFTDHLFLRCFPGNFVQVIDRPADKIKRRFLVEKLPEGRGDLAIRSSDRHLFFVNPTGPSLLESTLYGKFVRSIMLEKLAGPPAGVAYDQKTDRFYILAGGDLSHIGTYDLEGKRLSGVSLDRNVRLTSLAYDSIEQEFYVPLLDTPEIGVFSKQGHFLRAIKAPAGPSREFVDVGQRSLFRLF